MSNTVTVLDSHGNPTGTYASISAAISAATAGETVFIGNGIYNEDVTLKAGVNVEGQSQAGVLIVGTMKTPANFDNVTVSNLTVDDNSSTAMLLDMTGTQEVTSSTFSKVTFNLLSDSSATILVGNGQVAGSMALQGTGLTFSNVTMNSNDNNFAGSTAFAYTLFHSVGGAQMTLNGVSLNGTASGTNSGLGAQWNMSPNTGETANVTIENSSTSGGGNFYVSGMASATITNNIFNGQGLALNGVAGATVTGNTFENVDGTYNANGTQHRGLTIENAWGANGDSNITVENNTFSNITASDGAIAFQRWTDSNGNSDSRDHRSAEQHRHSGQHLHRRQHIRLPQFGFIQFVDGHSRYFQRVAVDHRNLRCGHDQRHQHRADDNLRRGWRRHHQWGRRQYHVLCRSGRHHHGRRRHRHGGLDGHFHPAHQC